MSTLHNISSKNYRLTLNSQGAELVNFQWKNDAHNWIWSGESWKRHAPVLFPIVGRLKKDRYSLNGKTYEMGQHGFARDEDFEVVEATGQSIVFKLRASEKSLKNYPYPFELTIRYEAFEDYVAVSFQVQSSEEIYFSMGWHPAFSFPEQKSLLGDLTVAGAFVKNSYSLLNNEGLIEAKAHPLSSPLIIEKDTFQKDALVFKTTLGDVVEMYSKKAGTKITMHTGGAPQFGIWSKNPAEFVCLEPWWGCADLEGAQGGFTQKYGIQHIQPSQTWTRTVKLSLSQI